MFMGDERDMYKCVCRKCGSTSLHTEVKGNNTGLYCDDCGVWNKWVGKDELRAFEQAKEVGSNNTTNNKGKLQETEYTNCYGFPDEKEDIELGQLCLFKPLELEDLLFGHMAGKVVDDFGTMSFMYVLNVD